MAKKKNKLQNAQKEPRANRPTHSLAVRILATVLALLVTGTVLTAIIQFVINFFS